MKIVLLVLLFVIIPSLLFADINPNINIDNNVQIKGYYEPEYSSELTIWPGDLSTELASRVSGGAFNPSAQEVPHDGIIAIQSLTLNQQNAVFTWYLENGSNKKMRILFRITPLQAEIEIRNSQGFITGHKFYIPQYTIYMRRGDKNSSFSKSYSQIAPYNNSQKGVEALIFSTAKWDNLTHHEVNRGIYGICSIMLTGLTDDPGTFEYISYVTVELSVE